MNWCSLGSRCALCVIALCCACGSDKTTPLTQIVVVVDSDLTIPSELDSLSLEVDGATMPESATAQLAKPSALPRSIGLVHSSGPLGPVHVVVRGLLAGQTVVERLAEVSFKQDATLELRMPLSRACADGALQCDADQTCDNGQCVAALQSNLPAFNGKVTGFGEQGGAGGAAGAAGGPAAGGGGGTGGAGGSQMPTCQISEPSDGAMYYQGDNVVLSGSCSDATGTLTMGLRWRSSLDGVIGFAAHTMRSNLSVGQHEISLCVADPNDPSVLQGCTSVNITVATLPDISASVTALMQGSSSTPPFNTSSPINLSGMGGGVEPLMLSWTDSIAGAIGTGSDVSMQNPRVGKHVVVFSVKDARGRTASDSRTFSVLAPGQSQLVAPYTLFNSTTLGGAKVDVLAADTSHLFVGASSAAQSKLYTGALPGASLLSPVASTSLSQVSVSGLTLLHELFLHASDFAYLAMSTGYQACNYAPSSGIDTTNCSAFTPGTSASPDTRAVLRLTTSGQGKSLDALLLGTASGLFVASSNSGSNGATATRLTAAVSALSFNPDNNTLWFATSNGLYDYVVSSVGNPTVTPASVGNDNAPSLVLTRMSLGADGSVWVGSDNGLGHYQNGWTTWRVSNAMPGTLPSNDVRDVGVARGVMVAGNPHDVIWIATASGVTRFDPTIASFSTLTTDDGLPSNSVRALLVLANGDKLIGTDAGLALYTGP